MSNRGKHLFGGSRAPGASGRGHASPPATKRIGRLILGLILVIGTFAGLAVDAVLTAAPAFAAQANTCIDPAAAGSTQTFVEGVSGSSYTVECEEETGISGTSAYPTISINTGSLPADGSPSLASGSSCSTTTSGSGTTEEYIEECKLSDSATSSDGGTYPFTFTSTPGAFTGSTLTPSNSGTLTITVAAPTVTCIDPASAGTAAAWPEGAASSYTVECEEQSDVSGVAATPSAIAVNTDTLPVDANPTLASGSSCSSITSGSGTTEEYIKECGFSGTPSSSDAGAYAATFTATGDGGVGSATSGNLNITVASPTLSCIDPASGGTAATWHEGVTSSYTVECEELSGYGANYPTIALNTDALPADANGTLSSSCTTGTSGSGTTEEFIKECAFTGTPSASDAGTYAATFTATGAGGVGTATSGNLNITVNAPTVTCIDPASGGTAATWYEGSASSYTVECEEQSGITSVTAYPSAIAIATNTVPADANTTIASGAGCSTTTSGSGTTEEYIDECPFTGTPTTNDAGTYAATFTATGDGGVGSATSGNLNITVQAPTTSCTIPASGGTSVSWVDGTSESESITCNTEGFTANNAGNYPSSITLNSGTLPPGATEATSTSSSPPCTTTTSGSGATTLYELVCPLALNPTTADNGTYHLTFTASPGVNGGSTVTSGTLTITIAQPAPSWETDSTTDGNYFSAIKGVPFCDNIGVTTSTSGGASSGSLGSLPLTSLTAGTTPAGVANYAIKNVDLATGTAQLCGTNNNTVASAPVTMAPVATNSGGSATDSIPLWSQNECTWTASGSTSVAMFDTNQDLETAGSQSAFGQPIANGEQLGGLNVGTKNYPTCTGGVGVSASGGLGDAWTINTANPLPTPTDTNPSAAQGDLASSNLDLASADSTSDYVGGCWGGTNILASTSTTSFGSGGTAQLTLPSAWSNGGDCAYGSLGSNSAGGNTDTASGTGLALCPPTQADVNAGYVDCTIIASSGNDENGSVNYSSMDLFFNGQPVPQTPTAAMTSTVLTDGTVTVSGGTNWWGSTSGAPNSEDSAMYGDLQNGATGYYPVSAPSVYIGTSRGSAVPVLNSTVSIPANTYTCTGAESNTVGPNPCTLVAGQPTGTFQVPDGMTPGSYNVYIDESNTTPLPGNGPSDAYQTARGTSLGTVESVTPITVNSLMLVKTSTTAYVDGGYSQAGDQISYSYAVTNNFPFTVTGIQVNDNKIPSANISCPSTSLASDTSETCTGTYTVTQADVDAGSVTNTATVTAQDGSVTETSAPSSVTVDASDSITSQTLVKSTTSTGYGAAGNTIPYSYLVTNTGTTTLNGVAVSDNKVSSVSCPDPTLAPGAAETCTGTYTVAQADVDAGSVTNTATASGTNGSNTSATSNTSTVTVLASNSTSTLSLVKSTTSTGYGAAGDTIPYSYLVTNTGTTTINNVAVSDNLVATVLCPDPTLGRKGKVSVGKTTGEIVEDGFAP